MARIRKSISIGAPIDRVFDYMADPTHLPEIWPSMVEVSNVNARPDGARSFDWIYKMAGIKFTGHSEPIEFEKNRRQVTRSERGIRNTFRWLYDGHDGATDVTLDVEYDVPVLGWIVGKLNEREAKILLENLKRRLEAQPSPSHHDTGHAP